MTYVFTHIHVFYVLPSTLYMYMYILQVLMPFDTEISLFETVTADSTCRRLMLVRFVGICEIKIIIQHLNKMVPYAMDFHIHA